MHQLGALYPLQPQSQQGQQGQGQPRRASSVPPPATATTSSQQGSEGNYPRATNVAVPSVSQPLQLQQQQQREQYVAGVKRPRHNGCNVAYGPTSLADGELESHMLVGVAAVGRG
jgi:hypothetical protein